MAAPRPDAPPVTTATRPVKSPVDAEESVVMLVLSDDGAEGDECQTSDVELTLSAESVDLEFHDVAGCQVREAAREGDALRRSGQDEVAGLECQHLAQL